ncbi:hypothetical protein P40_08115 [Alloalcanivorax xenomutans]|nr:hypothetical protein P40_08115 [Alloalcanivorax xenomutans]
MAGQFSSLLSVYLLFQFTSSPLMQLVNVMEKHFMVLCINTFRLLFLCTFFFVAHKISISEQNFVLIFSFCNALFYLLASFLIIKSVRSLAAGVAK